MKINPFLKQEEQNNVMNEFNAQVTDSVKTSGTQAAKAKDDISKAESLIKTALANGEYFRDELKRPFATVNINGKKRTIEVNSRDFRAYLIRLNNQVNKHIANRATIETTIAFLISHCLYDGEQKAVAFRVAGLKNDIYVDIGDESFHAIKITTDGWSVISEPPAKFFRTQSMTALPIPVKGGSVLALRKFLPQMTDNDFIMIVSWLVSSFSPRGPYAIMVLDGPQGSGKSTMVRVLRSLVDPSKASNRLIPGNARDLAINALSTWVIDYDNMSGCPRWMSDVICSIATEGTFATRALYTDASEMVFPIMRPICLCGIDDLRPESDMAQRAISIHLAMMKKTARLPEELFWAEFNEIKSAIFGAVLDAVVAALQNKKNVANIKYPRMADFTRFSVAATAGLPWGAEDFLAAYSGNINSIGNAQLEGDPVASVIAFMMKEHHELILSATEVYNFMETQTWISDKVKKSEAWPKSVNLLKGKLTRVSTYLEAKGIEMNLNYRSSDSIRKYKFINHSLSKNKILHQVTSRFNQILTKSSPSESTNSPGDNSDGGYESVFD